MMQTLPLVVGVVLAAGVGALGTLVGLDRDRSFYPVVTMVVAAYYVLFAVLGGSSTALTMDLLIGLAFVAAAVAGFRTSLWIVVAALAAHGLLDAFHASVVPNPGVPAWWPPFCMTYDLVAAAYLAALIRLGHVRGRRRADRVHIL
jgi:hypothetical protein